MVKIHIMKTEDLWIEFEELQYQTEGGLLVINNSSLTTHLQILHLNKVPAKHSVNNPKLYSSHSCSLTVALPFFLAFLLPG